MHDLDTIAAIATPLGEGSIAVIRVSGPEAIGAVGRIFVSSAPLAEAATHTVHYGRIRDGQTGEQIEEALVTIMRAPRSYTMEDIVEIGCHGGVIAVKRVLGLLLDQHNVRLAEPGEFTKRAFMNGRIDLSQAEAVIDLIRSKSDRAFAVALKQVDGALSVKVKGLRHKLVALMAHIEVNIDYPEHDVEELTNRFIHKECVEALADIDRLLKTANQGKILREGITTAIVGRPNVGKSSLLNALAQHNRAIVTDVPGTTRDVIEEYVTVGAVPLRLLDTAGIRETTDIVEQIGVERSRHAWSEADLLLYVLNFNEPLHDEEARMLREAQTKETIVIVNKTDLSGRLNIEQLQAEFGVKHLVNMSLKHDSGMDELEKAIATIFFAGELDPGDMTYVSNVRHLHLLKQAKHALNEAIAGADTNMPIDMLQIDIRNAWEKLGEVVGDAVGESLLDQIFSQFCLGK